MHSAMMTLTCSQWLKKTIVNVLYITNCYYYVVVVLFLFLFFYQRLYTPLFRGDVTSPNNNESAILVGACDHMDTHGFSGE